MPCNYQVTIIKTVMNDSDALGDALDDLREALDWAISSTADYYAIHQKRIDLPDGSQYVMRDELYFNWDEADEVFKVSGDSRDIDMLLPIVEDAYARRKARKEANNWGGTVTEDKQNSDGSYTLTMQAAPGDEQIVTLNVKGGRAYATVRGKDLDACNPLVHQLQHTLGAEQGHSHTAQQLRAQRAKWGNKINLGGGR